MTAVVQTYTDFGPHISYEELIASENAIRLGIRNIPDEQALRNLKRLSWYLEALRDKLREKAHPKSIIIINSGFRCPELNAKTAGSSKTSAHVLGLAADIRVPGVTSFDLARFVVKYCRGYDQVINEFGRWVHLGLSEGEPREQQLTSYTKNIAGFSKTVWASGIHPV